MLTLIQSLDAIEGRPVTFEEFDLWKRKRANARKRALHRYRTGHITQSELDECYKLVDSAPLAVIGTLCRFVRPPCVNTPLRIVLERNEGRSVTDAELDKWVKARKWRLCRLHSLTSMGFYTESERASIIKLLDSSDIHSVHNITVGVKVSTP